MEETNSQSNKDIQKDALPYSPVLKAGFLAKKANEKKNWHKRWFELTASSLLYYNSRKGNRLKGEIPLLNCIIEEHHSYENKPFVILLKTSTQKTFFVSAYSEGEMKSWSKSIMKSIKNITETSEKEVISPPTSPRGKGKLQKPKKGFITSSSTKSPAKTRPTPPPPPPHHPHSPHSPHSPTSPHPPSIDNSNNNNSNTNSNNEGIGPSALRMSGGNVVPKYEVNDPSQLTNYSKEQLIDIVHQLYFEYQKNNQNLNNLKQKSAEIVTSLKSQLLLSYSQNKTIKKELQVKDENIQKMQRKIVEAEQMVVDATPFQDSIGLPFQLISFYFLFFITF